MRITFAMSSTGLFYSPGLAEPVVLDMAALPQAEAARIEALVRDARVFDRPPAAESLSRPARDARSFTLTVEEDGRSRTLELAEPIGDPALKDLVRCLQDQVRALRRRQRES